jgi:hypothetical protein
MKNDEKKKIEEYRKNDEEKYPKTAMREDGSPEITTTGKAQMQEITGVENGYVQNRRLTEVYQVADENNALNRVDIGMRELGELQPKDPVESQLMTEMIGLHHLQTRYAGIANNKENSYDVRHDAAKRAESLSRAWCNLVDTLRRWRTQGTQTIKHVYVGEGGQAAFIEKYEKGGETPG